MANDALKRLASYSRTPGRWIISALESVQESHGTGRQDPGWFHPSSFGNDCDARLAFAFLGAPAVQDVAARTQRIFDNGSGRDSYLKADMARSGISLITREEDRKIIIPELRIRGELDDLVQNPVTKQIAVVDYKTMRLEEWDVLETVKIAHHLQLHPYMFAKQTTHGFVLYENKNNQEFKVHQADFNQSTWQTEIVDRINRIITGLQNGYVNRTPTGCRSCPYFANSVCTNNDIEGLKARSGLY